MNKGIIEIIINQTLLELLNEIQDPRVEIFWRPRVIAKGFLLRNIRIHDLFRKNILLVQKEHDAGIGKRPIVAHAPKQFERFRHAIRSSRFR